MSMQISIAGNFAMIDHETITVSSSSIGATAAKIQPGGGGDAYYALFTCETVDVRFWLDGTAPTSTVGHKLAVGQNLELHGKENIAKVRFISTGADATVQASYGR